MPVFNDFSHYYVGSGHSSSTTPSYTSSGYGAHSSSSSSSSPYSFPSPYSNRAHTNYLPSNYQSTNLLSTITGSGISGRYYSGNPKNSNYAYNYKGARPNYSDKYNDSKTNSYSPSPYTTYSLWKENQIASKWRNDNYRWKHLKDNTSKPIFIDTAKINVNKPRTKRQEVPKPNPIPERSILVEKPMVRDGVGTIKRGRTVVRMHTNMLKENPYLKKNEKSDHSEEEEEEVEEDMGMECRFNRMSPIRISRLKKRSVLQYKRHDSGNKHWLDTESDNDSTDSDNFIPRKSTIKNRKVSRSGTIKRGDTIKNKEEVGREDTVKRRYNKTTHSKDLSQSIDTVHKAGGETKKTDRRLSLEMYEEQTAILDSMIKEELAREDADDYFSDYKRGTVKIKGKNSAKTNTTGQSTDSNTDEEDTKKKGKRLSRHQKNENEGDPASEKSTPSSSRRNSLFQDLIIGETISETFIEDLENKIQNSYTNTEKVLKDSMPKLRLGTVKITQKLAKKPSRFEIQPSNSDAKIAAIVEVEENKPKTPKFFIEDVKIEASKFPFDEKQGVLNNEKLKKSDLTGILPTEKTGKVLPNLTKKDEALKSDSNITDHGRSPNGQVNNIKLSETMPKTEVIDEKKNENTLETLSNNENAETGLISKCDIVQIDETFKNEKHPEANLKEKNNSNLSESAQIREMTIKSNGSPENNIKTNVECSDKTSSLESIQNFAEQTQNNEEINNASNSKIGLEVSAEKQENVTSDTQKQIKINEEKINVSNEEKTNKSIEEIKKLPNKTQDTIKEETKSPSKEIEKITKTVRTENNKKKKSSSPEVLSSKESQPDKDVKAKNERTQRTKSPSPAKTEKNLNKPSETLSQTPPKDIISKTKVDEQSSSIKSKPKINLETNKKITKMKNEKPCTIDSKPTVDEKEIEEKIIRSEEEKLEDPNQKGNTVKVSAKKSVPKKKESSRPRKSSAIVHMKPRAMAIRTVENHPPSLKTPRLFPLPQPTKAVIEIISSPPFEESESSEESDDDSTATEGSSECSETSSDDSSSSSSMQGNQRNSTSSLDSGFGSACYKTKKGIALQIRLVY